jgi:hypothetical protein
MLVKQSNQLLTGAATLLVLIALGVGLVILVNSIDWSIVDTSVEVNQPVDQPSADASQPLMGISEETLPEPAAATLDLPDKILFVGNFLTFYNDGLDQHMEQLAASASPPLVIEADFVGGGTKSPLELVWTWTDAVEMIGTGDFDLVVLQEDLPLTDVDTFFEFARKFDAEIKKSGADTVLLMAWPYEEVEVRPSTSMTIEEIAQAHRDLATELGVEVAPVGLAWQRAMEERPEVDLYNAGGTFPSIYGTYLAANVVYATVLGKDPSGLAYLPAEGIYPLSNGETVSGITEEEAAFLRRIAWETIQEYQVQQ